MAKVTSTSEWQDAVKKHIDKLTDVDEKYEFAHSLIYDLALWTGYSGYEMIGILEIIKMELLDDLRIHLNDPDCDGDCDNCKSKEDE